MEENNRKGSGIFYAVVGVATLVVAIVGATFAFFTATAAQDSTTDITGTTAEAASLGLKVTKMAPTDLSPEKMVPLTSATQMDQALDAACRDTKNYAACQVYEIRVTSSTVENVNVVPTVTLTDEANAFTNLKFQLLTGTSATDWALATGKEGDYDIPAATGDGIATAFPSRTANTGAAGVWYFVVWLEEAAEANQPEAGKTFGGTVSVNATDATGNQISGTLTATF